TVDGTEFDLLVVTFTWWTKSDWERNNQPIYLWIDEKAYRVKPGEKNEERLIAILNRAARDLRGDGYRHPKYLIRLLDVIESRDNRLHSGWPLDRLEYQSDSGDWAVIKDRYNLWNISSFDGWAMTTEFSLIFRLRVADGTAFGVLLPRWTSDLNWPEGSKIPDNADPFLHREPPYQAVFIHYESTLFRIKRGADTEKRLLAMLKLAAEDLEQKDGASPEYLERLREVVKTREIEYGHFPMTEEEYEGE
ncbi:MAG: hypothetical protein AAF357_02220, partial [Verrucomicrobiota bacterium]